MKKKILPRHPSTLIRIAVEDLKAVEKAKKRFTVNMGTWHEMEDGKCAVCFAGAVMAKTLKLKDTSDGHPSSQRGNSPQLNALNYFREGHVQEALSELGIARKDGDPTNRNVAGYEYDKRKFKRTMLQLAAELEGVGL